MKLAVPPSGKEVVDVSCDSLPGLSNASLDLELREAVNRKKKSCCYHSGIVLEHLDDLSVWFTPDDSVVVYVRPRSLGVVSEAFQNRILGDKIVTPIPR